jgi:hypothetical protein
VQSIGGLPHDTHGDPRLNPPHAIPDAVTFLRDTSD